MYAAECRELNNVGADVIVTCEYRPSQSDDRITYTRPNFQNKYERPVIDGSELRLHIAFVKLPLGSVAIAGYGQICN